MSCDIECVDAERLEVKAVAGSAPTFETSGGYSGVLEGAGSCPDAAAKPVTVTVTPRGRTARFTRTDPCGAFKGSSRRIGPVQVAHRYSGVAFIPKTNGTAKLSVSVSGKTVMRAPSAPVSARMRARQRPMAKRANLHRPSTTASPRQDPVRSPKAHVGPRLRPRQRTGLPGDRVATPCA
jgi:hypothetical protein